MQKRRNCKLKNETRAIYSTKCKIGGKNDAEHKIGDVANLIK